MNKEDKDVKELEDWKKELAKRFSKIAIEDSFIEESGFGEESDVQVVMLNINSKMEIVDHTSNPKLLVGEEDLEAPELLSDSEKFSSGSLVVQKDLFDSFIIQEPKIKDSFAELTKKANSDKMIFPLKKEPEEEGNKDKAKRRHTLAFANFKLRENLISPKQAFDNLKKLKQALFDSEVVNKRELANSGG